MRPTNTTIARSTPRSSNGLSRPGLAGATVLRGIEGFGASSHIHTTRILRLSEDLPVVIVIVDIAERIDAFLPQLDELITEGLIVREQIDIVSYRGRES